MHLLRSRSAAAAALVSLVLSAALLSGCAGQGSSSAGEPRFQSAIETFLEEDKVNPPPRNAILFIGSSIFRQWTDLRQQRAWEE